jgi:hypothetical protein
MKFNKKFSQSLYLIILLIPYSAYLYFVIGQNQGPVDYETFMTIGNQFLMGKEIYSDNSYYPMPFVIVFGFFSMLPKSVSLFIWLIIPVILALFISKFNPYVLLYAPLFGHFVGGQSSVFGMLGLWGYRENINENKPSGGIWLSLTLIKPQLGIIPLSYALFRWIKYTKNNKHLPKQAIAWLISTSILYFPTIIIKPDWVIKWITSPRPFFSRAMSAFIPRTLMFLFSPNSVLFWLFWFVLSSILIVYIFRLVHGELSLDLIIVLGFVISPFFHDYDLIQLIPIFETKLLRVASLILSIPGWLVIIFAYTNDSAWYVYTFIGIGILFILLYKNKKSNSNTNIKYL